MTRAKDISKIVTDADLSGTLDVTGTVTAGGLTVEGSTAPTINIKSTDAVVVADDVVGAITFEESDATGGTGVQAFVKAIANDSGNTYDMSIGVGGNTEAIRIDQSGNVGIGTSSPVGKLNVIGGLGLGAALTGDQALTPPSGSLVLSGSILSSEQTYTSLGGSTILGQVYNYASIGNSYRRYLDIVAYGSTTGAGSNIRFITGSGTSNAERMRINSSGNVGIGTSSPSTTLHLDSGGATTTLQIDSDTEASIDFNDHGGSPKRYKIGTNISSNDGQLEFKDMTANAERMRIDSSGNLLVGKASTSKTVQGAEITQNGVINIGRPAGGSAMGFYYTVTGASVGKIAIYSSSTQYVTTSDYRLKENVSYDFDATTRLKQLRPARFNFIADADTTVDGFLAHEVQSVVPEAISGTHNEVDDDGNPVYQGIDQSKLVPLLVKTIQELEARIVALETA